LYASLLFGIVGRLFAPEFLFGLGNVGVELGELCEVVDHGATGALQSLVQPQYLSLWEVTKRGLLWLLHNKRLDRYIDV